MMSLKQYADYVLRALNSRQVNPVLGKKAHPIYCLAPTGLHGATEVRLRQLSYQLSSQGLPRRFVDLSSSAVLVTEHT